MVRLHMIRHGKDGAGFGAELDPGLDDLGRAQAEAVAAELAPLGPCALLTSPLLRARETAAPLAALWGVAPVVARQVAEIPSGAVDLKGRRAWLGSVMAGAWSVVAPELLAWRRGVVDYLRGLERDAVIFSHFIAINVAVGHATGEDRVRVFRPDNGSITTFETDGGTLRLITLGREAETEVR